MALSENVRFFQIFSIGAYTKRSDLFGTFDLQQKKALSSKRQG